MQPQFWQEKWDQPKRGWSQTRVNSRLVRHWSVLNLDASAPVLVPLCGDSIDLDWLIASGHRVVGSELVEEGLEQWFARHALTSRRDDQTGSSGNSFVQLQPEPHRSGEPYVTLSGDDRNASVRDATVEPEQHAPVFLCGDFFAVNAADLPSPPAAVYDRAALIALPQEMRKQYVEHLGHLLEPGAKILLITLNYAQEEMKGPPFSVTDDEVYSLYSSQFTIEKIDGSQGPDIVGNLAERGLTHAGESVFLMMRK